MPPSTIPRFLLPQSSSLWRARLPTNTLNITTIRNASAHPKPTPKNSKPKAPFTLEKPSKFNPPSHGARKPRDASRYPGPALSAEEKMAQKKRKYPSMMPPEGTFMHWFITNKSIHVWITLTTLATLATIVWSTNFKRTSPFADMLPSYSSLLFHPITSTRQIIDVIKLNSDYMTKETQERRRNKVEDVAKRSAYRKAHGLDGSDSEGFGGWSAKSDSEVLGTGMRAGDDASPVGGRHLAAVQGGEGHLAAEGVTVNVREEQPQRPKKPLKKWLGIW